jgi:hypothetical protein
MIQQAARRSDHHVDALPERGLLRAHADAAEDGRDGDAGALRERTEVLLDLGRQLTGGDEHERARPAARLLQQVLEDGQREGRGLAAAGRRAREHVAAGQAGGNRLGLHRRRLGEAHALDRGK